MATVTLSNAQHLMGLEYETQYIVSAVLYLIPAILIVALNGALFRQLKHLLNTHRDCQFSSLTPEIKKVLFKIRLTILIAFIFVGSQIAYAISTSIAIVSWVSFVLFLV